VPHQKLKGRSELLLLVLVALLILYPHLERTGAGRQFLVGTLSAVLIAAVFAVSDRRSTLIWGLLISIPTLVAVLLYQGASHTVGTPVVSGLQFVFFVFTAGQLLRYVVSAGPVDLSKPSAAISVYLLLGLAWAAVYVLQEAVHPGSFSLSSGGTPDWSDLMYYSYVTLTTLGYGDITPASTYARSSAVLEAITGVLYMAILVARLVSLYGQRLNDQWIESGRPEGGSRPE
jgi:hypothetical protein